LGSFAWGGGCDGGLEGGKVKAKRERGGGGGEGRRGGLGSPFLKRNGSKLMRVFSLNTCRGKKAWEIASRGGKEVNASKEQARSPSRKES